MTPASQAPAPASTDLFASFEAFIAAGHDERIDHWPPPVVEEYAEFYRQHKAEYVAGAR